MILALDLGTTTGWALEGPPIVSGVETFKTGRYSGGGMRYLAFRKWIEGVLEFYGPSAVYFEEVRRHAATDAAHVYGGLLAQLTVACEQRAIAYQGVPVGAIKKHATGMGNASKAHMMAAMEVRGHRPIDDNEADALAILYWARETQGGVFG